MSRKHGQLWTAPIQRAYTYLLTGKVEVIAVDGDHLEAIVTVHDGAVRVVNHGPPGWTCTCPQKHNHCAHILAVRRIAPGDLR